MLRDASELITPAVADALGAVDLKPEDAAAAKLARLYALRIDQATVGGDSKHADWAARWLGPLLLACLESLGATPAARAAITGRKGAPAEEAPDALALLKPRRRGA